MFWGKLCSCLFFKDRFLMNYIKNRRATLNHLCRSPWFFCLSVIDGEANQDLDFQIPFSPITNVWSLLNLVPGVQHICDAEISAPNSSSLVVSSPIKGSILPLAENRDPFLGTRPVPRSDASRPRSLCPRTGSRVWQELKEREEPSLVLRYKWCRFQRKA